MFLLFGLVVYLLGSAGSFACYVGMLASWPIMHLITAASYRDKFGVAGAQHLAAAVPPPPPVYGTPVPPPVYL